MSSKWQCDGCTYDNFASETTCEICGGAKPGASSPGSLELASYGHGKRSQNSRKDILGSMKTKSVVWLDSVRGQNTWDLDGSGGHNPAKGLKCLHFINSIIIIGCMLLLATVEGNILDIRILMPNEEGTFVWSFGWLKATFRSLNDATCEICSYDGLAEEECPIPAVLEYNENAGRFLIAAIGVMILCVVFIMYILCERANSHERLFISCKCFKIPQRPAIFHAYSVINRFILISIIYFLMVAIYGFVETDFYMTTMITGCTKENGCWMYPHPHFGYCALVAMFFTITFFAYSKAQHLDDKLTVEHLDEYYPENVQKSAEHKKSEFDRLLKSFTVIKNIAILSFIMAYAFQDVGMITILFKQQTYSGTHNQYLEFQGMNNKNGIIPNFYASAFGANSTNSTVGSNFVDFDEKASSFSAIAESWDSWLACITGISLLMVIYLMVVMTKYHSNKCMKTVVFCVTLAEWLGHVGLMGMYYYEWSRFFSSEVKSQLEQELLDLTDDEFIVSWYPDWGALIALLLLANLTRFMFLECKTL